jgi:conjugal transfer ATP-binding protein TraC
MASRGFWDRFLDMLFGESAHPEATRPVLGAPMLSNWLPYRSFDKKSRMFINTDSVGFILELAPMMGADERSGELLTQFLSDAVPSGCEIQLIHWQSPSVGERIADWVMPRVVAKGVYGRAAMHRARWLRRAAWMSISRDAPFYLRNTRVILSIGARLSGPIGADTLVTVRESLMGTLQALSIPARDMSPVELIAFLDDFLCPAVDNADKPEHYSELDPINVQCVRRDLETQVTPDRIVLNTERFRPTGERQTAPLSSARSCPTSSTGASSRCAPAQAMGAVGRPEDHRRCHQRQAALWLQRHDRARAGLPGRGGGRLARRAQGHAHDQPGRQPLGPLPAPALRAARRMAVCAGRDPPGPQACAGLLRRRRALATRQGRHQRAHGEVGLQGGGWDLIDERYLQVMGLLAAMPLSLPEWALDGPASA